MDAFDQDGWSTPFDQEPWGHTSGSFDGFGEPFSLDPFSYEINLKPSDPLDLQTDPTGTGFHMPLYQHKRTPSQPCKPLPSRKQQKTFQPEHIRQSSLPAPTIAAPFGVTATFGDEDHDWNVMLQDADVKFNPRKLGFIPTGFWPDQDFTFGELVSNFFQRKNSANSRFFHKLYNALRIAEEDEFYAVFLGVEWVNEHVIRIEKKVFARLLAIKTIDGSLFHHQGNFPTHGFAEVKPDNALQFLTEDDLVNTGVDYDNVRLLYHTSGVFNRSAREEVLDKMTWTAPRKR